MRIVADNWENKIKELENRIIAKILSIIISSLSVVQPEYLNTREIFGGFMNLIIISMYGLQESCHGYSISCCITAEIVMVTLLFSSFYGHDLPVTKHWGSYADIIIISEALSNSFSSYLVNELKL